MNGLEVAIVGMAGRFPGARSVAEFWRNLRDGVESVTFFTDEELLAAGEDPARLANPRYVRAGAVLDDIDRFDAAYFGVTPREAEIMDPQHRVFLECAVHALEDAGHDPARFPGAIGVYGGAASNTYFVENLLKNARVEAKGLPTLFGNQSDYLTTRVSYKLDLRGPSLDVQTGCSSSLVAVHLACQALLAGECDLALAGGVAISVPHGRGYVYQDQGIYSPDGHCRAFSSDARGTAGGNGVAIVVLRRLQDALDDGDAVRAVVKGSAINNDGSRKVGYAAPSVEGQVHVIRSALEMAEVEPASVGYVEAHGTGTSLGDPIEVAALTEAFGSELRGTCALGSVKTNIGHLDTAAGATGLIKIALAMQHGELPASLNCATPNPAIDFPSTPFRVNTERTPWRPDGPRRAGVSSFGIGGTNAHVVLEEAPAVEPSPPSGGPHLAVLSARTVGALDRMGAALAEHLRAHPDVDPADVAWTLQVGRRDCAHRRTVVARDAADLAEALEAGDRRRVRTHFQEAADRSVAFLFPGQGAQYVGMGAGLYAADPVFREHVDRACEILAPHLGRDLRELLYPAGDTAAAARELKQTRTTQPALFVVEHALARVWMDRGVRPDAMLGHSIGEYVAATLAGVFGLEDALALVAARGRLMQELPRGSMLAVPLPPAEVEPRLGPELSLAVVNEHSACVASGPPEAVADLARRLSADGVEGRELHTSHAFHSAMMEPILEAFTALVRDAGPRAPEVPFVSNVSGTWITDAEATDPAYWARHLRRTVRFADGVDTLLGEPRVLLEVGPGNTLTTLSGRLARRAGAEPVAVASMRHPREEADDRAVLLGAVGQVWQARVPVDWRAVHGGAARRRVPLPGYPFDETRYWVEPDADGGAGRRATGKRADVSDWFWVPSWKRSALLGPAAPAPARTLALVGADARAAAVAARLAELGSDVVTVRAGDAFADEGDGAFALRPGEPADWRALTDALRARGGLPERVLHLFGLDPEDPETDLDRGLYALLFLAQAAGDGPLAVDVVARGTQDVSGDEDVAPAKAAVLGVCRAVAQECPGIACRAIDVGSDADADALLAELAAATADAPPEVALRGRHRWVRAFEPVRVEAPASTRVRAGGHYLVTGGLGSIGLEVAAALARAGAGDVVLMGRSDFPPRADWDAWCAAHAEDDETRRRIEAIRAVEALGARVHPARGDVTDRAAMEALLRAAEERAGPLHGVVHAAGGAKTMALLAETGRADVEAQLGPKLRGLAVLEELLAGRALDFCVVQSSLSSVLGALAMVGYVAAHHVVDAFVARHNRAGRGTPWTSANWDNWLSWKEPEFAHEEGGDEAYYMTSDEGGQAFARVLALPPGTQVVVSTGDLEARLEQWSRAARDDAEPAQELHERPELASDWVAPEGPVEEALARAWSEVLGIGNIGANDSFFELGGDSVLGLQVVAKVARAGFRITPAQIFEHPTIAGLAAAAAPAEAGGSSAEQGPVTGAAPLLPIQRWFFEQGIPDPAHFNLPALVPVPADADAALLARALDDVVAHHDALRLRYRVVDGAVEQVHAEDPGSVDVADVDLAAVPADERPAAMRARAAELHAGLDLEAGPLVRAALFRFGPDEPAQLLWVVHHLVVDAVSWRVLTEDLGTALEARRAGRAPELPPKTTSFRQWAEALAEHARSDAALLELDHWRATGAGALGALPVDSTDGDDVFATTRTVTVSLDEEATRALVHDVGTAYGTRVDEVLLTALVRALAPRTGSGDLLVDLEGHGREGLGGGLDLSRTVGWLTTLYPARLSLSGVDGPGAALKAIKEQVRAIPRQGLGWGALRYARGGDVEAELAALPRAAVNFLYLGQFDAGGDGQPMGLLQAASGAPCGPDVERTHLLAVVAWVSGGRLTVEWSYGANRHEAATVEAIAADFRRELELLIAHAADPDAGGHTPSDFPAAQVKQADLDKLLTKIGKKAGPR